MAFFSKSIVEVPEPTEQERFQQITREVELTKHELETAKKAIAEWHSINRDQRFCKMHGEVGVALDAHLIHQDLRSLEQRRNEIGQKLDRILVLYANAKFKLQVGDRHG